MSFRVATFLLVAVLAFTTDAAFQARTLLHEEYCDDACEAAQGNDPDEIRHIIDEPHSICNCECNNNGWTPMLVAAKYGCSDCIEHIITAPSNCPKGATNKGGNNAVHIAAKNCQSGVIEKLIEWGFNVNAANSAGNTPLCDSSCNAVTRLLKRANANGCNN